MRHAVVAEDLGEAATNPVSNLIQFRLQGIVTRATIPYNIPSAGDNDFTGSGQWQAGPAAVFMVTPVPGLQTGLLAFQLWEFHETRSDAQDVSVLSLQPILTKYSDKGWYIALPDTPQTYNFETNEWALNLGGVLGRVFPAGGRLGTATGFL